MDHIDRFLPSTKRVSLLAEFYHQLYVLPDYEIVKKALKASGGPLIDLGCASGRVLEIALGEGYEAVGIEHSADMLTVAKQRLSRLNKNLFQLCMDDFVNLEFEGEAGVITCMANTFPLVTERVRRTSCILRIYDKLKTGGTCILFIQQKLGDNGDPYERTVTTDRGPLTLTTEVDSAMVDQGYWVFKLNLSLADRVESYQFQVAIITPDEILADVERAGFSNWSIYGDFDLRKYDDNSKFQVHILEK